VLARHPDARLLLVGSGPAERSLRRAVAARGLERSVVLSGPVATRDLPGYYAAGDVFAMPCRTRRGGLDVEGLGMVFLEAAACGLPVVAGTSGGAPETVREGVTGHVVEPRSAAAVARTIGDLLADRPRARAMGAAGRTWVEQRWSWATIAATFAQLLDERNGG
jgi:phosphatidylinositol alpha-1,6-mannosyltransferase